MPQQMFVKEWIRLMVTHIICHFNNFNGHILMQGPCYDDDNGLECDNSGMFQPVQCNDDSCWCVDPENGTEIPDTRIDRRRSPRVLPNCFDSGKDV